MTKQKVGLALFWIVVVWVLAWGVIVSVVLASSARTMTMDELNQTMWATTGSWYLVWGIFGVPLGAIIAGVAVLLYSGAKGSTVWKFGIGIALAVSAGLMIGTVGHIPLLFGIGGTLILLFFIGILWFWAKERKSLEGASAAAADLKLVGYVFILIAAWFTCGVASLPFLRAFEEIATPTPIHVMVYFVLGWLFLRLSHYKSRKQ